MIESKNRYSAKKETNKTPKAKTEEVKADAITEELKKDEPKEEKKKPVKKAKKKGIVDTNALNVRTAPIKDGNYNTNNVICVIRRDAEVIINESEGTAGWLNITTEVTPGVKVTGFVMSKFIKEVQ